MESAHTCVSVLKLVGMRGGSFVFTNLYLMNFLDDTLKASHDSTKMEFMWWGKTICLVFHNPHIIHLILKILPFVIQAIIIGLVVDRVVCFQYEGLGVLVLCVYKCEAFKVYFIPIEDIVLLLMVEVKHTSESWVMDLIHPSLYLYPYGVWWDF